MLKHSNKVHPAHLVPSHVYLSLGRERAGASGRGGNLSTICSGAWMQTATKPRTRNQTLAHARRLHLCDPSQNMPGIVDKLRHDRDKARGVGTNSHAVKFLNQDFECLRSSCLERGQLFEDESFEALPSSLGFNELGPNSLKVRGITWKRPTVEWRQHLLEGPLEEMLSSDLLESLDNILGIGHLGSDTFCSIIEQIIFF